MNKTFILFISLILITGCEKTIDFEKLQERNGVYYEVNSDKPFTGKVSSKYDNGQKEREGNTREGKEDGLWTWWYENGQKEKEGNTKEGKEDGLWTYWNENGNVTKTETYSNGELVEQ